MTFQNRLDSPKLDFMQNQCGGKIIKFQQSQALTSHFESFWSIVSRELNDTQGNSKKLKGTQNSSN